MHSLGLCRRVYKRRKTKKLYVKRVAISLHSLKRDDMSHFNSLRMCTLASLASVHRHYIKAKNSEKNRASSRTAIGVYGRVRLYYTESRASLQKENIIHINFCEIFVSYNICKGNPFIFQLPREILSHVCLTVLSQRAGAKLLSCILFSIYGTHSM